MVRNRRRRRSPWWALGLVVLLVGGTAAARSLDGPVTSPPATVAGPAGAALESLVVKGRAPRTGYARSAYGPAWSDVDGNGCNTRDDVLGRDLTQVVRAADGCDVLAGTLLDPYGGATVTFAKARSEDVQVDHVVALSDAWQKGASAWSDDRRLAFANDPLNLLAVSGRLNQGKGDGDAATWLPPQRGYRCAYVARQVAVKAAYGLWTTPAEHDAIARVLDGCPEQVLPRR